MGFKHLSRLQCDTCGAVHGQYPGVETVREARSLARKDGWKRVKHFRLLTSILGTRLNYYRPYYQDHCPACLLTEAGQTEKREHNGWQKTIRTASDVVA